MYHIIPGGCIGRGAPELWPPRSPDLTPLEFFLWGYVERITSSSHAPGLSKVNDCCLG